MSDIMTPISFDKLINWILTEKSTRNSIFSLRKFFKADTGKTFPLFKDKIESPIGPAAGPHTQLAQNIITAYCAGSRFFELKTVQKLFGKDLPVSKPCIHAADECYNVEWSTELHIDDALAEYIKAWIICKILAKEYNFGDPDGFIFNMSVGYDLEGIKSPKVDNFINSLKNAENTEVFKDSIKWLKNNIDKFQNIDLDFINNISSHISNSITISTLHGCPPQEIEKIANYLLEEKQLNTFVKCNPTLLGYETARNILNNMGYDYVPFDDHHFKEDLQMEDALPMLRRLQSKADSLNLEFGVKLTNTCPVDCKGELPGEEMYMSGKALFPLSLNLAYKLSEAFNGQLKISYAGGVDFFNFTDILNTGIYPITMATTLLKPGGYARFSQLAEFSKNINISCDEVKIDTAKLKALVEKTYNNPHYLKPIKVVKQPKKLESKVPKLNCFTAPCNQTCPINQDIPEYISLVSEGKYTEALEVILDKNPLPFITGTICSHYCMGACTRNFYEESLKIRDIKLTAAKAAYETIIKEINVAEKRSSSKIAIVGGGVAGIAVAYFLAREGFGSVNIFEKENKLGGIVRHVIPEFRISEEAIEKDINLIKKLGVNIHLNTHILSADQLKEQGFDYIIWATGANKCGEIKLEGEEPTNALRFLRSLKEGRFDLGKNVAIIGGGNTSMDAARAAVRDPRCENCYIIYRRDKRNMPADEEEIKLAEKDGVQFKELLQPIAFKEGKLICSKMELTEADSDGRRRPVATSEQEILEIDNLIAAVGERVDLDFFEKNSMQIDGKYVKLSPDSLESSVQNMFVIGDAHQGPCAVVKCIKDARIVSDEILKREKLESNYKDKVSKLVNEDACFAKKGYLMAAVAKPEYEALRCLNCSCICENCVDVCPNRANISIEVPRMGRQVIHIDAMCNECGNCAMFCPYDSAPYRDKLTLFNCEEDFKNSSNDGFWIENGELKQLRLSEGTNPENVKPIVNKVIKLLGKL